NFSNFSYLFILIIGWVIGYLFEFNIEYSLLIDVLLYLLAFVAGLSIGETINLNLIKNSLGIGLKIIFVVILSDIISSVILYFLSIRPYSLSLSICLGSGWYTYTGSIIASYYGSYYGTLAFLINFFREQFTFILVPILFRVYPNPISIIAIGGATSMDTTLGLYSLVLGPANSISALISGVLLTAIIPIVIPLAIYLVPM
ncbi:MAG: lysine exporter LysO family protein, partial [Sulfolobales archaeon]